MDNEILGALIFVGFLFLGFLIALILERKNKK